MVARSQSPEHTREFFSWTIFRTYEKCGFGKAQHSYSLPERPKLRDLPEDQNHKGPVQKTHWRSRTSCIKFWWFDHSRSQNCLWRMWISKQSSICSGGNKIWQRSGYNPTHGKRTTYQETEKSWQKFLEPKRKPDVTCTDNSLEFGKACEDLSWNHCTSTPHRSETNGIAERAVRRLKEGTSSVLFQSGLDEKWWADSMECLSYLWKIQDLLPDGKTPYERRFGESYLFERPVENPSIWKASITWNIPRIRSSDIMVANVEELETMDASEIYAKRLNAKEVIFPRENGKIIFPVRRWTNKIRWRRSRTENIHLDTGSPNSRRRSKRFSRRIRRVSITSRLTSGPSFTLVSEKPPEEHMWSGRRLTKRQATSRPDHLWPELWIKLGRNA